ncbi:uncharacterized protein MONBRDRAFT_38179 [Monosiga brevicollis MX1]|uniref:Uncharacterized protein n=1 Tax=Monosiga brevicollis TaxID=81824 RepID=A9V650_MONBE|nr:uncharacterized protein MONBRDRAFT_38179 [Monosiga brevicollis MX1]EDQ86928.1 predicted protein [Monosiga brevicollis MX1]|eukprot:XP_001748167.1 hypothetical protein [Monosiga brevicollis MX1]
MMDDAATITEEVQDDGAPKPKRAARKQGTASAAAAARATASQETAATASEEAVAVAEQALQFLRPRGTHGIMSHGVTADTACSEKLAAVDAAQRDVTPDDLQNAVKHACAFGVPNEGLLVAFNIDHCPDTTHRAARGAKFFFDDDARKLFISKSSDSAHDAGTRAAAKQVEQYAGAYNALLDLDRLLMKQDTNLRRLNGDAPDVALAVRTNGSDLLPFVIIEVEVGNRDVLRSRQQGAKLFQRYKTLRGLLIISFPEDYSLDPAKLKNVQATAVYYSRAADGPASEVQPSAAHDLGTVPASWVKWTSAMEGDCLPPVPPGSVETLLGTSSVERGLTQLRHDRRVKVEVPGAVIDLRAEELASVLSGVTNDIHTKARQDLVIDVTTIVESVYPELMQNIYELGQVWTHIQTMQSAVDGVPDGRRTVTTVTQRRMETCSFKAAFAFEQAYGEFCGWARSVGRDVRSLAPRGPKDKMQDDRTPDERQEAVDAFCAVANDR